MRRIKVKPKNEEGLKIAALVAMLLIGWIDPYIFFLTLIGVSILVGIKNVVEDPGPPM